MKKRPWLQILVVGLERYRHEAGGLLFGIAAGMGFAAIVGLHAIWDIFNSADFVNVTQFALLLTGNAAIAVVSVILLIYRYREAKKALIVSKYGPPENVAKEMV